MRRILDMKKLRMIKNELRARAKQIRDTAQKQSAFADVALMKCFQASIAVNSPCVFSGFSKVGSEINPSSLMNALNTQGNQMVLPVVTGPQKPLTFRRWSPGEALSHGPFGIREPSVFAKILIPDLLLIPLLAFDRSGNRLGYGGGFYDRTLKKLRKKGAPLAVGIAFAAQELESVPVAEFDQTLNWIVTEREAIKIGV